MRLLEFIKRPELCVWFALAVGTALLFSGSVSGGFVHDDHVLIGRQPQAQNLALWTDWFTGPYWPAHMDHGLYRPLVLASFAFNHTVVSPEPWSFRLTNVLLHALATALVGWTGRRMGLTLIAAAMAGLLFGVHPAHAEVIGGIVNRTDSLAALFSLLAVNALLSGSAANLTPVRVCLSALFFFGALLCKESSMLLPPLLLFAAWRLGEKQPGQRLLRSLLLFAGLLALAAAVFVALKVNATGSLTYPRATWAFPDSTLLSRLPLIPWTIAQYLRLLLWPISLSADYGHALPEATPPNVLFGLAVLFAAALLVITGTGMLIRRGKTTAAFSVLWLSIFMAPYLHVFPFSAVLGERFLYVPTIGLCWLAGCLIDSMPRAPRPQLLTVLLLIAALWSAVAVRHTLAWRDEKSLWEASASGGRIGAIGWQALGVQLLRFHDSQGALGAFRRARDLGRDTPEIAQLESLAEAQRGRFTRAEEIALAALERWPGHAGLANNLASALMQADRHAEAQPILEQGLERHPHSPELWANCAIVHLKLGRMTEARAAFASAEALGVEDTPTLRMVRHLLQSAGQ